ncbi:MAG TPA: EAL domain-containing protein [Thermoanaerobaculia bacterium]|nr:EAL domain-containing protein [Thermoanaerobaculia bacterium]
MISVLQRLRQPGAIRVEFQPVVRVQRDSLEVYAYEALARGPRGTSMERPAVMFEFARRKGVETEIDLVCIAEALNAATALPGRALISLNVHGATLASTSDFADRLLSRALSFGILPDRLMLEIIEHRAPWIADDFRATLDELRAAGVRIAVDDLGVAASNFQLIIDCQPDHVKVDRYLIDGCSADPWRRASLASIVTLARAVNATVVAEGVETVADLETLLELGIDIVQGWLYSPSKPAIELAHLSLAPNQRLKGSCS